MTYKKALLIGLGGLLLSVLLLIFNAGSPTTLGAIGRVVGGLLLFPSIILIFDGIAKSRSLYLVADVRKKDGTQEHHYCYWHTEK